MSAFISAHAGHADWTIAFASCREQLDRQLQQGQNLNLGWCYLSDYYAKAAGRILAALRDAMPALRWVSAVEASRNYIRRRSIIGEAKPIYVADSQQ